MRYEDVQAAFEGTGLICRGGFRPVAADGVPGIGHDADAAVVVVGNAGSEMWRCFAGATSQEQREDEADPLNGWTTSVVTPIAARLGARACFPFDRPYLPFQRWAMKADAVWQSPLGPLIHPQFGLWHAYRAALVFTPGFSLPAPPELGNPCNDCEDRPCLTSCPVAAYSADRYDVPACIAHIGTPDGQNCIDHHCLARRACPVGRDSRYSPPHAAFHMSKFLNNWVKRYAVDLPGPNPANDG